MIARYIGDELERLITEVLDLFVQDYMGVAPDSKIKMASDYAAALQNDTWLMETTEPPEDAAEWSHINERLAPAQENI